MKKPTYRYVLYVNRNSFFLMSSIGLVLLLTFSIQTSQAEAKRERIACAEYANPQATYDSDPVKYKRLDRDGDGIPCEAQ